MSKGTKDCKKNVSLPGLDVRTGSQGSPGLSDTASARVAHTARE